MTFNKDDLSKSVTKSRGSSMPKLFNEDSSFSRTTPGSCSTFVSWWSSPSSSSESESCSWFFDWTSGAYPCPTYKTSTRSGALSTTGMSTNYILPVDIPTPEGRGPSYWILQGVAMLCALND